MADDFDRLIEGLSSPEIVRGGDADLYADTASADEDPVTKIEFIPGTEAAAKTLAASGIFSKESSDQPPKRFARLRSKKVLVPMAGLAVLAVGCQVLGDSAEQSEAPAASSTTNPADTIQPYESSPETIEPMDESIPLLGTVVLDFDSLTAAENEEPAASSSTAPETTAKPATTTTSSTTSTTLPPTTTTSTTTTTTSTTTTTTAAPPETTPPPPTTIPEAEVPTQPEPEAPENVNIYAAVDCDNQSEVVFQSGWTLGGLGQECLLKPSTIISYNSHLENPDVILPGTTVYLKPSSGGRSTTETSGGSSGEFSCSDQLGVYREVQAGESRADFMTRILSGYGYDSDRIQTMLNYRLRSIYNLYNGPWLAGEERCAPSKDAPSVLYGGMLD